MKTGRAGRWLAPEGASSCSLVEGSSTGHNCTWELLGASRRKQWGEQAQMRILRMQRELGGCLSQSPASFWVMGGGELLSSALLLGPLEIWRAGGSVRGRWGVLVAGVGAAWGPRVVAQPSWGPLRPQCQDLGSGQVAPGWEPGPAGRAGGCSGSSAGKGVLGSGLTWGGQDRGSQGGGATQVTAKEGLGDGRRHEEGGAGGPQN